MPPSTALALRRPVAPLSSVAAEIAGTVRPRITRDPAALLASLLDLPRSVELARRLTTCAIPRFVVPSVPDPSARSRVRALVEDRLGAIRAEVEYTFANPYQRRNKLPSPADLFALLCATGSLTNRRGRPQGAALAGAWSPLAELLVYAIARARQGLQLLRADLGDELVMLGPRGARLEHLDAALMEATAAGRRAIEDRLVTQLEHAFAADFATALRGLPKSPAEADVAAWFGTGGFILRAIGHGRRIVLAIIASDERRLDVLTEAS